MSTSVYISDIPSNISNGLILQLLECCGAVDKWTQIEDPLSGKKRPFGFSHFSSAKGAYSAIEMLNDLELAPNILLKAKGTSKTNEYLETVQSARPTQSELEQIKTKLTDTIETAKQHGTLFIASSTNNPPQTGRKSVKRARSPAPPAVQSAHPRTSTTTHPPKESRPPRRAVRKRYNRVLAENYNHLEDQLRTAQRERRIYQEKREYRRRREEQKSREMERSWLHYEEKRDRRRLLNKREDKLRYQDCVAHLNADDIEDEWRRSKKGTERRRKERQREQWLDEQAQQKQRAPSPPKETKQQSTTQKVLDLSQPLIAQKQWDTLKSSEKTLKQIEQVIVQYLGEMDTALLSLITESIEKQSSLKQLLSELEFIFEEESTDFLHSLVERIK